MLFGRDAERDRLGELLDAARASRSGVLVIRGEPGAGKTALLQDTVERAADMQVLSARGLESEAELPFAALRQLLRPALGHLDALPEHQAGALRNALGLDAGAGQERFLVYSACLTLLSELAERRPVLCIVDDAHWLDGGSADALRFVARRLGAEGLVILFGAREGDVRSFEAGDLPDLMLAGLDAEAAEALIAHVARVSPEVRARLAEHARGNALAPRRAAQRAQHRPALGSVSAARDAADDTCSSQAAFHARVARLPEDTRRLLLIAAVGRHSEDRRGDHPRRRRPSAWMRYALDPAERERLVSVHGNRIVFHHPLVRSAVYGAATSRERRVAHRALADALTPDGAQVDRRAWHLAAAAVDPDESVVRELDAAAARAESRGGRVAAARAQERAAELSIDPRERSLRLVRAARNMSLVGQDDAAVVIADRAQPVQLAGAPSGPRGGAGHDRPPSRPAGLRDARPHRFRRGSLQPTIPPGRSTCCVRRWSPAGRARGPRRS